MKRWKKEFEWTSIPDGYKRLKGRKEMANSTNLYGLYDLGDDGTILYSHDGACRPSARPELVGRNFFEDVSGFDNIPDFRLQFYSFLRSRKAVESFILDSASGIARCKTKVYMARAFENDNHSPHERVMLVIREGA